MLRSVFLFIFLFLLIDTIQAGDVRRVKKAMEKADYEKAEVLIKKSLANQEINPGVRYLYSVLYITPEFPRFNIDNARNYIRRAIQDFEVANQDDLEELTEEEITKSTLITHLERIIQLAFEKARDQQSIMSWQTFIEFYPEAKQNGFAVDSRDSLIFQGINKNSLSDLREFLVAYPNSIFRPETQNILDRLLVSQFWKSKSTEDLERFILENQESEYKETAIKHLLKLRTLSGKLDNFLSFIQKYPATIATTQAVNFMYHLDKENGFKDFNRYVDFHSSSDSLRKVREVASLFQFAIFDQTYQLISNENDISKTNLISISADINCFGLVGDVISGSDSEGEIILSKRGTELIRGKVEKDLGAGFLQVNQGSSLDVYHKSGARILKDIEEAEILNNQFLKARRNNWALYTLMGIALTDERFDDIFMEGDFWFFRKADRLAIISANKIVESFTEGLYLEFKFDDYELVDDNLSIGFRGDQECLLKSDGEFLVPWGKHHIYPHETNGYVHDQKGYAFYGPERYTYYPYLEVNDGFILRKEAENQWMLFSNEKDWFIPLKDSVKLLSRHSALITGESPKLIFQNQKILDIGVDDMPLSVSMTSPYTLVKGEVSLIIDSYGKIRFSGNFDSIEILNDSLFSVSFNKKYGVLNRLGEEILPIEFDYLSLEDGMISFINKQKIGAYDLTKNLQFKEIFESKLERINHLYRAKKSGSYGLINSEGIEVLPFEYEEFFEWTDSLVWGKQDDLLSLIDLNTHEAELQVTLLSPFETGSNTLMKFYGSNGFGLIGKTGTLLQPIYSEIVWIGDETQGVIMADRFLPEAGFHVVTYFDASGRKILSQAYSKEDFEKVLCNE
ncbi:MAG: WG repeat-containing protein [Cytophagales bacterium]|nr:WG repeat-containing protein [Cytophagales bacterium]